MDSLARDITDVNSQICLSSTIRKISTVPCCNSAEAQKIQKQLNQLSRNVASAWTRLRQARLSVKELVLILLL